MPSSLANVIDGLLADGREAADGSLDPGRLTLADVQWASNSGTSFATLVLTARQIEAAADSRLLWTDQNVQRGVRPELVPSPPALLALADGYPDPTKYIFDRDNADDIVEKLLSGQRLLGLNPLVWNLRPDSFEAYFDSKARKLHLYRGRIFLPDSHHRHQAILRAVRLWRDAPDDYPNFNVDGQFTVELYFMSVTDEAEYFFEKNQLGKRADRSRAYELSGQDVFALTAKRFAELSPHLKNNVNRVTDRLTARNPQIVTLSTLRTMAETFFAGVEPLTPAEIEEAATRMSQMYDMLVEVRPELGLLTAPERARTRTELLVDQAVMMHGYARLMHLYADDFSARGRQATAQWRSRLKRLAADFRTSQDAWKGDFFSRENPAWKRVGILQDTKSGRVAVSNTRQTREVAGQLLVERLEASPTAATPHRRPSSKRQ